MGSTIQRQRSSGTGLKAAALVYQLRVISSIAARFRWPGGAVVAALRETGVLFGAAIAVVFLNEPLRATRIAAAVMIGFGLALIRLQ